MQELCQVQTMQDSRLLKVTGNDLVMNLSCKLKTIMHRKEFSRSMSGTIYINMSMVIRPLWGCTSFYGGVENIPLQIQNLYLTDS